MRSPDEKTENNPVAHSAYLIEQAKIVKSRISCLTDFGLWLGLLAVLALVAALAMSTFRPDVILKVSVGLPDGASYTDCPRINGRFEGRSMRST